MTYCSLRSARKPATAISAFVTFAALAASSAGLAQSNTAPQSTPEEALEEVVVSGRREPGAVIGDIQPELQLSAQEIRALGVGNVSELLQALAPQLGSGRGRGGERPVVLVNGVRVSGFAEIRDLPTEAIMRTDILSEEVALKYGYRADQRVVNLVLRPRFRAWTAK
jgi:iron complex outermembrane receptor protein